jgi:hypothetical protein
MGSFAAYSKWELGSVPDSGMDAAYWLRLGPLDGITVLQGGDRGRANDVCAA